MSFLVYSKLKHIARFSVVTEDFIQTPHIGILPVEKDKEVVYDQCQAYPRTKKYLKY